MHRPDRWLLVPADRVESLRTRSSLTNERLNVSRLQSRAGRLLATLGGLLTATCCLQTSCPPSVAPPQPRKHALNQQYMKSHARSASCVILPILGESRHHNRITNYSLLTSSSTDHMCMHRARNHNRSLSPLSLLPYHAIFCYYCLRLARSYLGLL